MNVFDILNELGLPVIMMVLLFVCGFVCGLIYKEAEILRIYKQLEKTASEYNLVRKDFCSVQVKIIDETKKEED